MKTVRAEVGINIVQLVDQIFTSWNPLLIWLRLPDRVRRLA